jgi:uncharacterized protein (DUF1778 family)
VRPAGGAGGYRLDRLGWLQFERLASLVLEAEAGLRELDWHDRAYRARTAWVDGPIALAGSGAALPGPALVAVVWSRGDASQLAPLAEHGTHPLLVVTELDGEEALRALGPRRGLLVLGASELGEIVDRHASVRAAMPSLLGLRDLAPLIPPQARGRSTLDVARAQALARVFVPTRAYERARQVLARHRFVVLTGPPEMGKTAIAHMTALAQLTTGWEAHDCISPDQVWSALDRDRPQVFVADDAFGSTEYRPDAAERWARELGRLLRELDERHWLIWTSRPAPLRAGLRRVQRERGSERFPAPGEVLVDASDLDLAEKTLILFRHVKDHRKRDAGARALVRASGLAIVEHEHLTPERIRRFVSDRLDDLVAELRHPEWSFDRQREAIRGVVERELATPTAAMAASFRALEEEHRALLVALLDTPAGLADERELAAAVRRHHPAGLRRPPHELIDRLTDHFLRITSLGIDWVHPSWRDLVIDELRTDRDARRRFLRACGPYGALLVLSREGGTAGERALPLLVEDGDWDAFTDRAGELVRELEDQDLTRLLLALRDALSGGLDPSQVAEACSLAEYVLAAAARSWDKHHRPLPVFLLEAWFALDERLPRPLDPPDVAPTWAELHPASLAFGGDRSELLRAVEWLALAETLDKHDPVTLGWLGFPDRETGTLLRLSDAIRRLVADPDRDARALGEQLRARLERLAPCYATRPDIEAVREPDDRWWVPEDIPEPPTTERLSPTPPIFTREDVDRVLRDL